MENIEKIRIINAENLNSEFYFQSLLEEAYNVQLITENEIERIQYQCLELLANKTESFNVGDSSVRVEVAQNIMISNVYTVSIWLKTHPHADDAIIVLKKTKISELYANGRKRIDTMIKTAKALHSRVLKICLK